MAASPRGAARSAATSTTPKACSRERYDGQPGTVYLIRPDQHVAARWRGFDVGKVRAALRRCIAAH